MTPKPFFLGIAIFLSAMLLSSSSLANPTGLEIMTKADQMNRPQYEIATMRMELVSEKNSMLKRELIWHFRNEGDKRTSLMKFTAPANIQGVGILVIEEKNTANAIWHYLPASRNVRRISAEHRQNRFMGTEFVFEDFEGLKLDKYQFVLIGAKECTQGSHCYVIEGRATDKEELSSSSYGKKIFWVNQRNDVIVKTEFYDKHDKLIKVFEGSGFRRFGNYWRPTLQTMSNLLENRSTRLIEIERKLDQAFEPYYTSQQYLRSE